MAYKVATDATLNNCQNETPFFTLLTSGWNLKVELWNCYLARIGLDHLAIQIFFAFDLKLIETAKTMRQARKKNEIISNLHLYL